MTEKHTSEWSMTPGDWPSAAAFGPAQFTPQRPLDVPSAAVLRSYRCKHVVEAMRWFDTDREAFAAWFDVHDQMFETRGSVIVLPDECGEVQEGEWVLWSDGEFLVMDDDSFILNYEAA